jgi:hypothetical protein
MSDIWQLDAATLRGLLDRALPTPPIKDEWLLGKGVRRWIPRIAIVADEGGVANALTTPGAAGDVDGARAVAAGGETNAKRC